MSWWKPIAAIGAAGALLATGFALGRRPAEDSPSGDSSSGDARPDKARKVESPATQVDLLESLGYVDGTYDPKAERSGVIRHLRDRCFVGLNLYNSRKRHKAQLIDMEGRVVHEWKYPSPAWQHVELFPDGSLLVMLKDRYLMKLDVDSNLLWRYDARVHHDLGIDHEGNIHVLTRRPVRRPELSEHYNMLLDHVTVLSPDGELLWEMSLLDALLASPYAYLVPVTQHLVPHNDEETRAIDLDVLHTNHVEVFDGTLADRDPLFTRGNMLVSMRNINAIAVVDGATRRFSWLWGPSNVTFQHHSVLLDSGRILLFDNGRRRSRIIELDPLTRTIEWQYGPRKGFFSKTRGSNQRLPNGNTLITESDTGYAFEVTEARKKVWEFANPDVDEKKIRMAIWRMTRFHPDDLPFLAQATE